MQRTIEFLIKEILPEFIGWKYDDEEYIMTSSYKFYLDNSYPIIGFGFYMDKNKVKKFHMEVHSNGMMFIILEDNSIINTYWR